MNSNLFFYLTVFTSICCSTTELNKSAPNSSEEIFVKIKAAAMIPGSIYLDELLTELDNENPDLSDNLTTVYEEIQRTQSICASEFSDRAKAKDPNYKHKIIPHKWVIHALLTSKDNKITFSNLKIDSSSVWPDFFDEELKKCYLNSIEKSNSISSEDFYYNVMFKQCAVPGPDLEIDSNE